MGWRDPVFVNHPFTGRVILRRGQANGGTVFEADDALHGSLAKCFLAHEDCTAVILEGSGNDLGCTGGAAVDKDGDLDIEKPVSSPGTEDRFLPPVTPLGVNDHLPAGQELLRHIPGGMQEATGIIAKIENQGSHALVVKVIQCGLKIVGRRLVELCDPDVAETIFQHVGVFNTRHLDVRANDCNVLEVLGLGTKNFDRDRSIRRSAKLLYRLLERHALRGLPFDLDDLVPGLQSRPVPRGIFHRRDDGKNIVLHTDHDAQPPKLSRRILLHVGIHIRIKKLTVLVQRPQHAAESAVNQLLVRSLCRIDVVLLHLLGHHGEERDFVIRIFASAGVGILLVEPCAHHEICGKQESENHPANTMSDHPARH